MNCITGQFHITYTDTGVTRQVELLLKGLGREMIATMILCVLLLLLLLLLLFTAIGFSPGGSSPYTSTHNTNGNIIHIKVTMQNKLYTITKQYIH